MATFKEVLKQKTVFITGSSGFVGGYLRKEFELQGYKVIGTDLRSGNAEYIMDVTKAKEVDRIIGEVKPDYIVHLAGFASVRASFDNPELCYKVNVGGTKNVLDAMMNHKLFDSRILIISSSDIYEDSPQQKLNEESPTKEKSPYGKSRIDQEKLVHTYDKIDWIISRSFPHIGPGQPKGFVTADFASQIADANKDLSLPRVVKVGRLDNIRDFSDVRDTVVAYRLLLEKGEKHEVYNVCSGVELKIKDILNILISFSEVELNIEKDPEKIRTNDIKYSVGDSKKLVKSTEWKTRYSIKRTLKDIYNSWLQKND